MRQIVYINRYTILSMIKIMKSGLFFNIFFHILIIHDESMIFIILFNYNRFVNRLPNTFHDTTDTSI